MPITYEQKRNILDFMSDPGRWSNVFDMDFFLDERRKWHTTSVGSISLSKSPERNSFFLQDTLSGADLLAIIDKNRSRTFNDESGRQIKVDTRGGAIPARGMTISKLVSKDEIGLGEKDARVVAVPELASYVRFYNDGAKAVFLDDKGIRIGFDAPEAPEAHRMHNGRFFHVIRFDLDTAARWGMTPYGLLNGTKLIVSKDLSIEPDLRTFNDLDPDKAAEYLNYLLRDDYDATFKGPWQWRPKIRKEVGDIGHLQKKWTDITEFAGYFIATPRQFYVETTDDGFNIATSLDSRETIWAQAAILKAASSGKTVAVETMSARFAPQNVMHLLQNGQTMPDHRGRSWSYVVIHAKDTAEIARQARQLGRDNFGLTGYHFAALNYDDKTCVLAMDSVVLERLSSSYDATVEMLRLIKSRSTDSDRMKELLDAGADLRFVNPQGASKGRSLANEMLDTENFELLGKLKEHSGVHDLTEIKEDEAGPPEPI